MILKLSHVEEIEIVRVEHVGRRGRGLFRHAFDQRFDVAQVVLHGRPRIGRCAHALIGLFVRRRRRTRTLRRAMLVRVARRDDRRRGPMVRDRRRTGARGDGRAETRGAFDMEGVILVLVM